MHVAGERHFDAAPEEVYRALTDPDELALLFGAIERVEVGEPDWTVVIRPPVPGAFRLKFSVHFDELREPEHARFRAWGKSVAGRISVDSSFDLTSDGGTTAMRWSADVDAAGLFTGLGAQALGPVAKQQADRALQRLGDRLRSRVR